MTFTLKKRPLNGRQNVVHFPAWIFFIFKSKEKSQVTTWTLNFSDFDSFSAMLPNTDFTSKPHIVAAFEIIYIKATESTKFEK
ncbi:hypothetical protein BpHYR1_013297 [Brachionus plicatilis]|uniref:Uncharacterized protein n=1 Tax=Brachionus plicatilis TaxID=10195 RepID=A0A3M7RWD4_BRAPC|nr:hypothetical protein BpHYR1_013297 [Brachionus plicatilis]